MKKIFLLFFFTPVFSIAFAQDTLPYFIVRGNFIVPKQATLKFNKGDSVSFPYYEGGNKKLFKQLLNDFTSKMSSQSCGLVTGNVFFNSEGKVDSIYLIDEYKSANGKDVRYVHENLLIGARYALEKMSPWVPLKVNSQGHPFIVRLVVPYGNGFNISPTGQASAYYEDPFRQGLNNRNFIRCMTFEISRPTDRDDFFAMGIKLLTSKNFEEAALWFSAVLESNEKDLDALFNRAICYLKLNDLKSACKDWEKAAKLGDPDASALILKNCK